MNEYFTNLVGRHLGTCDTIQPRTLGRFEADRGRVTVDSPDEGTNPVASESDQTLQPPGKVPYEPLKEPAPEINPLESTVVNGDRPINPRSALKLHDTQPLGTNRTSHPGALEQEQPNKATLVVDEYGAFSDGSVQTNNNESHEGTRDKNPPLASHADEHYQENDLNHRIRTMLQRLADDPVSPVTESAPDNGDPEINERQMQIPSDTEIPMFGTVTASLDSTPASNRQSTREDIRSPRDRENVYRYSQLETPSWLPEIESQINRRLQEIEAKAEPVVNVTIGRVEVRAVQSEAPKQAKEKTKPTGVMSLDDYLKQRDVGKQR